MTTKMAATPAEMRRALHRVRQAVTLNFEEATVLLQARGEDLAALCEVASRIRETGLEHAGRPGVITYSRKVFVPLTLKTVDQLRELASGIGRPARQPTTTYDEVGAERLLAAQSFDESLRRQLPLAAINS